MKYKYQAQIRHINGDIITTIVAPCTEAEFLAAYLERAADDLIIG